MSPCVSMSPCGYGHGVSPFLHVDMDTDLSMSPCGYYIITHMDFAPCLHIINHVDLAPCSHNMDMDCLHVSM